MVTRFLLVLQGGYEIAGVMTEEGVCVIRL